MTSRGLARTLCALALTLLFTGVACPSARADVGIVLNESLDVSVDRISGTGHSAVYFSRICPESPVKLRLCGPDEHGSVMSTYINIGERQRYEWNVAPFYVYLYGVEDPRFRPLAGSYKIKNVLEERYRKKYLAGYCDGPPCSTSDKAEWREMVAATMVRSIYIFVVDTTVEQDKELIEQFNASPNQNHFNGVTRNCADFTRRVINRYFPHAANPDYLNDFGMTTPKAIARSFARYASRNPHANFRVLHFAQEPGTIKRSSECRSVTEQLYHSKKLLVPMLIFADYELPVAAASYLLTGRFNPEREFEKYPAGEENSVDDRQGREARARERARVVGTPEEWESYRKELDLLTEEAAKKEILGKPEDLRHLFKQLNNKGTPQVDGNGELWMEIADKGRISQVGLSASNILGPNSNAPLAYSMLLWRAHAVAKSPKHSRETMPEFQQDWKMLQKARLKNSVVVPEERALNKNTQSAGASEGGKD